MTELNAQMKPFQAQVGKVLDIVVNSLYSHNEIFLRELISNASDACDKLRYAVLTHPEFASYAKDFKIELLPDKKAKTLTIRDNGIGMNEAELSENLGTIAHSGSAEFASHLTGDKKKDLGLIGQFGVGFYASFMVAEKVEVISKKIGDEQGWKWTSDGKTGFTVEPYVNAPQGTSVILHLKKDFEEYLDPIRLRFVVRSYSDHIDVPVILDTNGKTETLNTASALWTRHKADITPEQYRDFYRQIAKSFDEPYATIHYKAEGVIEYTGLLFIPSQAPFNLFQPDKKFSLNLYVNRVFISDEVTELLPHYLRFVKGVVDTTDLPLNVSREILQYTPVLTKIRTGIEKRVLNELKEKTKDEKSYETFWKQFGIVFKEGLYEDKEHTKEIAELCRFASSKEEGLTTFADYVKRMPKEQKNIYYITGDDINTLKNSPQLEGFTARGIEVLLLSDPIDEFWPEVFREYDGKGIRSVTNPDSDVEKVKPISELTGEALDEGLQKVLTAKVKEILGTDINDVRLTDRLYKSPVALVAGAGQMSIHLERLMKQHGQAQAYPSERILELNPRHPLVKKLAQNILDKKDEEVVQNAVRLLYDEARAIEGEPIKDTASFAERLNLFMEKGL